MCRQRLRRHSASRASWCMRTSAPSSLSRRPRTGVRMIFSRNGNRASAEATLAVLAVGWVADIEGLRLASAGVETDHRGFVQVDEYLRTSTPHIFAAGDITGRQMLVPQAIQDGFVAATNAVRGPTMTIGDPVSPIGSFTDPEYAQVGLTEAKARETHDVVTAVVRFDSTTRTIIDGRTVGFLQTDRRPHDLQDIGLPHCWRARSGDRPGGGDSHCRQDAGERLGAYSALISHLRRNIGSRGGQRDTRTQSESELASTSSGEHLVSYSTGQGVSHHAHRLGRSLEQPLHARKGPARRGHRATRLADVCQSSRDRREVIMKRNFERIDEQDVRLAPTSAQDA